MTVDGQILGPGGYAHHPGGTTMLHEPAGDECCTFVLIFDAAVRPTLSNDAGVCPRAGTRPHSKSGVRQWCPSLVSWTTELTVDRVGDPWSQELKRGHQARSRRFAASIA